MSDRAKSMNRREFLKFSGRITAVLSMGQVLSACASKNNYSVLSAELRRLKQPGQNLPEKANQLIKYAVLAANNHNSQPWKFSLNNDLLSIIPDFSRGLSVVDPNHRELWISLGCALENLLISAQTFGLQTSFIIPQTSNENIQISLKNDSSLIKHPLFSAIRIRQSNRAIYNAEKVGKDKLAELEMGVGEIGIKNQLILDSEPIRILTDLTEAGDLAQFADQNFINELASWLRFNQNEATGTRDGLYSICSGNPNVSRWLGRISISSSRANASAEENRKKMESSSGFMLISSEEENIPAWINSGRLYQRLALQMTQSGIQSALMNQALEIPHLRTRLAETLPTPNPYPQLLLRFGYAESMPYSLRRDSSEVMI